MRFVIENSPMLLGCLIICAAKILEISIQSMKTVFLVKGNRLIAALLAFIECLVWGFVVSAIITDLQNNIDWLFAYCLGYAAGIYLGGVIENKIAIGTSNIELIVKDEYIDRVKDYLKENNLGFTTFNGEGSTKTVTMILIVLPRKKVKMVTNKINEICNGTVFEVASEVSKFVGGYGIRK